MKKLGIVDVIAIIFIVIIVLGIGGLTYLKFSGGNNGAVLQKIVDKFNASATVKTFNDAGGEISAAVDGNKIVVDTKDKKGAYTFTLENDILTCAADENDLSAAVIFVVIVDSTEQLLGLKESDVLKTLNSEEIKSYTLAKNNVEVKQENNQIIMSVNVKRKMTLANLSGVYITPDDLKDYEEYIKGDGAALLTKGNLMFTKNGYDDEATILIYEENELTEATYKSLFSVLTVMFNESAATEFSTQYPSLSQGNKTFGIYKVEINPELDDLNRPTSGNYKWVRVTVDKSGL